MYSTRWLAACVFALSLVPTFALADEPSLASRVKRQVEAKLVSRLESSDRLVFSRVRQPPVTRRVRVTQRETSLDAAGRAFVAFAVDSRFGSRWRNDEIVGCAYPDGGQVYVKMGNQYRPADILLGKDVTPVEGVCVAGPRA